MEDGDETYSITPLKRQREPLSDSDDANFPPPEEPDGQKRRRLEAAGRENRTPKTSSSGRLLELETKPDTPIVPSVRSRVLQLSQTRDDPGGEGRVVGEPLLGEKEFNQRLERFKEPVFQDSPFSTPNSPNPRTRSDFVSVIQQKLQGSTTPSSKQASRIRQEREQELSLLHLQPISENAWLKRSNSDPSFNQGSSPVLAPLSSSRVPRTKRKFQWPPTKPCEQVSGDEEFKDGSLSEASTSGADMNLTGGTVHGVISVPVVSVRLGNFSDEKEQSAIPRSKRVCKEEEKPMTLHPEKETVQKLSFSEDPDFFEAALSEDQTEPELGRSLESPDGSSMMEREEQISSEIFSIDGDKKSEESSHEAIETSTEEELRIWKYPTFSVYVDKDSDTEEELRVKDTLGNLHTDVSTKTHIFPKILVDETPGPQRDNPDPECCAEERDYSFLNTEPCEHTIDTNICIPKERGAYTEGQAHSDDDSETKDYSAPVLDLRESEELMPTERSPDQSTSQAVVDIQASDTGQDPNWENTIQTAFQTLPSNANENDKAQSLTASQTSRQLETGSQADDLQDDEAEDTGDKSRGESSKKVTFSLEPELINSSMDSTAATTLSDAELSSNETNTAEIIDQMFDEVLEYAGKMEEGRRDEEDTEDRDSGIYTCSGDKDKAEKDVEKEGCEEKCQAEEGEWDESKKLDTSSEELLGFPPSGILSPLSKSIEAVVTPLRLAATQKSNPPSLLLTPEETSVPPKESAPLYSVDAYRTQRQSNLPTIQSVTPGLQRRAADTAIPQPCVNSKEKITALNDEAAKLQTIINQTLQALSCCTDEEHGRGSLEEAEAEKLLLVSCEKRSALLAEVNRLREQRSSESEDQREDQHYVSQQPCRGTVSIMNIQLPLKVEFVCSSHNRPGRPSHYFFVLIRYGNCTIVATPLATAADAKNGDTISFNTSVTLKDIGSSFEIDVEVYSLAHTSGTPSSVDRASTKSRVTPRKLLSTLTKSSNTLTSAAPPALNARRSSSFSLVGSHKITLASLGHNKFPLDKMKLEGKIRRLLGDEFQEKVPFLSPLEGNIYLHLESTSHSQVQHQGFLTMFELVSGYGVWNRRYFLLEGCNMYYWNHPNDREAKEAEGSLSLCSSPNQCVRPVKRDSCARPFTFELVSSAPQLQQDNTRDALAKCWFSADTKQERLDWMEKLSQALLDFHTWNRTQADSETSNMSTVSTSGSLRESLL